MSKMSEVLVVTKRSQAWDLGLEPFSGPGNLLRFENSTAKASKFKTFQYTIVVRPTCLGRVHELPTD